MNILISINNKFVFAAIQMLKSLHFFNNVFLNVYLLYEDLTDESIQSLKSEINEEMMAKLYLIKYDFSTRSFPSKVPHISKEAYFRLYAPFLLPQDMDRILYLDSDIIINGNIEELYNMDFEDAIFAAVENIDLNPDFQNYTNKRLGLPLDNKYINSGVLLINLKKYKDFITEDNINQYIDENYENIIYMDQDIINKMFYQQIKVVPETYNYQINHIKSDEEVNYQNKKIIHYLSPPKPWLDNYDSPFRAIPYYQNLIRDGKKETFDLLFKKHTTNVNLNEHQKQSLLYEIYKNLYNQKSNESEDKHKMIDVIIPAYNAHGTIKDTLSSIIIQTMKKDIHVYIIDDCSEKDYKEEVNFFKSSLDITELRTPRNMGPGGARQYGIDNSQSEYIMFVDADDMLHNCFSIENLYKFISSHNYNAVCSNFLEENDNGTTTHNSDIIWMHGKMYRRRFLVEKGIRFNTEYTGANEDTGFNHLVYLMDGIPYLNETTYIWRNNGKSITRRNNREYSFSGLEGYIHNTCYAVREAFNRGADKKKVATLMCKIAYCTYLKYLLNITHPKVDLILEWSKEIEELYNKTKDFLTYEERKRVVGEQFDSQRGELDIELILNTEWTFNKFLDKINE